MVIRVICPHCGRQIGVEKEHLGAQVTCPGCLRGIVAEENPDADSSRSRTPDSGATPTTEDITDELISKLREMNSTLKALAKEFLECLDSKEPRHKELARQYQGCLEKHVPEVAELLERLELNPFISLHDADSNMPVIKVYDPEMQKDELIAANPRPYEALAHFIDWLIEYVGDPEEGKAETAQSRRTPEFKMKRALDTPVRQMAEACCIDDDATLRLIERVLVHEEGDLRSLADAIIHVTSHIMVGDLVLGGDTRKQMTALVIVLRGAGVTLPPDIESWATEEGLFCPSQKTQIDIEIAQVLRATGEPTSLPDCVQTEPTRSKSKTDPTQLLEGPDDIGKEDYVFCKHGAAWRIIFNGRELAPMKDMVGFQYIAVLLEKPDHPFDTFELNKALRSSTPPRNPRVDIYDGSVTESNASENITVDPSEEKTRDNIKKQIADLDRDIADEEHNATSKNELLHEKEQLLSYLSSNFDKTGKPRSVNKGAEKARQAVFKAITRTYTAIEKNGGQPELLQHFKDSISLGAKIMYRSSDGISWITR